MDQRLVSVIIPTYNRPDMLQRAVRSVQTQVYKNVEILVVDDSPERIAEDAVCEMMALDPRIKYLANPSRGLSSARNFGIRNSHGEYLAFLDDDDEWVADKLAKQIAFMLANNLQVCFSGAVIRYASGESYTYMPKFSGHVSHLILAYNPYILSTSVIKSSAATPMVSFDESLRGAEDWDLWVRLARLHTFGVVKEVLATIHKHGDTLTANTTPAAEKSIMDRKYGHLIGPRVRMYRALRLLKRKLGGLLPAR